MRMAEFHALLLLRPGSHSTVWKRDHEDDMEFILNNASVVAVMEHISFTVAKRIHYHPDSKPAVPISHTRPFTSAQTYMVCHLIKWACSAYYFVMYIQMYHKSFTSYFLLLLTSSEALITLSQQSDHFRRTWMKSKGTALKNSRKNSVSYLQYLPGNSLRGVTCAGLYL